MKKHSAEEILAKLRRADELAAAGQSQSAICKTLGVSVMTLHRWRKQRPDLKMAKSSSAVIAESGSAMRLAVLEADDPAEVDEAIHELRLENQRLRRIVADLLIEKMKVEDELDRQSRSYKKING